MKRASIVKVAVFAAVIVILFVAARLSPLGKAFDPQVLVERRDELLAFVGARFALAACIYVAVYFAAVALSVPGASALTILGGFLFGPLPATLLVNVGATAGAMVIFLLARGILGGPLREKYGAQLASFDREIRENGASYLLFTRLVPVFPFFVVNLLAGLTVTRPRDFLWTTALGILPGSFAYAYLGSVGATGGESLPGRAFLAFLLLALVGLIPVALKKLKARSAAGKDRS